MQQMLRYFKRQADWLLVQKCCLTPFINHLVWHVVVYIPKVFKMISRWALTLLTWLEHLFTSQRAKHGSVSSGYDNDLLGHSVSQARTFGSSLSTSSAYQRFTTKWNQFQLPFSLHFLNSRMKLYLVHDNSRSASYKLFYPALSFTLNFKII